MLASPTGIIARGTRLLSTCRVLQHDNPLVSLVFTFGASAVIFWPSGVSPTPLDRDYTGHVYLH